MKHHPTQNLLAIWVLCAISIIFAAPQVAKAILPYCFGIPADDPTVCSGNGTCVDTDTCECIDPSSYTGPQCGTPVCDGILATETGVCSGNGTCVAPDTCSCEEGYSGNNCEIMSKATPGIPFLLFEE